MRQHPVAAVKEGSGDGAIMSKLLEFLQQEHSKETSSAAAAAVFLETFRVHLRDRLLSRLGTLAPVAYGASHSPFKSTTALYE